MLLLHNAALSPPQCCLFLAHLTSTLRTLKRTHIANVHAIAVQITFRTMTPPTHACFQAWVQDGTPRLRVEALHQDLSPKRHGGANPYTNGMWNGLKEISGAPTITDQRIARREIERSDAAHNNTMRRMFGIDWQDPGLYTIALNTARVSVDDCVEQITRLAESPAFQETTSSRLALLDQIILARVHDALDRRRACRSPRPHHRTS